MDRIEFLNSIQYKGLSEEHVQVLIEFFNQHMILYRLTENNPDEVKLYVSSISGPNEPSSITFCITADNEDTFNKIINQISSVEFMHVYGKVYKISCNGLGKGILIEITENYAINIVY